MLEEVCNWLLYMMGGEVRREYDKRPTVWVDLLFCSGGRTRTSDLRVMSPTSYQLLYSAML